MRGSNFAGQTTFELDADMGGHGGLDLRRSDGTSMMSLESVSDESGGAAQVWRQSNGNSGIVFQANELLGNGANLLGYNWDGESTFELDADDGHGAAYLSLRGANGSPIVTVNAASQSNGSGSLLVLRQSSGDAGLTFYGNESEGNGASIYGYNQFGSHTFDLDADDGNGRRLFL